MGDRVFVRMKRFLIASLVLALAGAGLLAFVAGTDGDPPTYRTAPIQRGALVSAVTSSGTVAAVVTVEVGSQLSGQVAELLADFNDEVRRGQPLARLDPQSFEARVRQAAAELEVARAELLSRQAAVEQAAADFANARGTRVVAKAQTASVRATYDEAELDLRRKQPLAKSGAVPESALERALAKRDSALADLRAAEAQQRVQRAAIGSAKAALRIAEAKVEIARATIKQRKAALDHAEVELARSVIRAPLDGVVIGRNVDLGQTVAASLQAPTLFTIAQDLRLMQVEANVDEADIGRVKPGQRVTFTVDAYRGRTFGGEVAQIRKAPQVVQNVVTYTVVISTDNGDLALLPGMTATVRIVVAEKADVLKVPNAALRFRPSGTRSRTVPLTRKEGGRVEGKPGVVWVPVEDGRPMAVAIRTGTSDGSATEVVSGPLSEGREVIIGTTPPRKRTRTLGLRGGF